MNIKSADRIIVKSNDRMKIVLDWYIANRAWLDKEEFHAPLASGVIVLQEEMLDVAFEEKQGIVEISIYPRMDNRPCPAAVIFDYDPQTFEATHYRFAPQLYEVKRDLLRMVILSDNTDEKAALKYHALMLFMAHYREVIPIEETRLPPQTQHKSKKKKRQGKPKAVPLIKKTYVLSEEITSEQLRRLPGEKRPYTKPDHEVSVRGYRRRYKSGKVVWVKPSVRYKDRGAKQGKDYQL